MRRLLITFLFLLCASPSICQWSITGIAAKSVEGRANSEEDKDILLEIMIRNDLKRTLYVQGIKWGKPWYMVEEYIKHSNDDVWERYNSFVDQKLEMIPVRTGEEFKVVHRVAKKAIGRSMMLTLTMAYSENDTKGNIILLGPVNIPEIRKRQQVNPLDRMERAK